MCKSRIENLEQPMWLKPVLTGLGRPKMTCKFFDISNNHIIFAHSIHPVGQKYCMILSNKKNQSVAEANPVSNKYSMYCTAE